MPFEIVGLDFVGREGREEDMAGVDEIGSFKGHAKALRRLKAKLESHSGWWPFSRQMTPQEAEQKAENIMQKQNIQTGQGKVVSAKDFGNSITAASKELGGQEIAKGYVLTVLARKGMGFMDSQGKTYWPSFASQKA
jgi:hypothetical protein